MAIYFITNNKNKKEVSETVKIIKGLKSEVVLRESGSKKAAQEDGPRLDALIAEIRKPSMEINYQIVLALTMKKPVLCIYPEGTNIKNELPTSVGNIAKNLTVTSYNKDSLASIIKDFVNSLGDGGELNRFNFFLPLDLLEYINWIPFGKGTNRSNFIRQLIRDEMNKDSHYHSFVKKRK